MTGDLGEVGVDTLETGAFGGVMGGGLAAVHRLAQAQGFRDSGRHDLAADGRFRGFDTGGTEAIVAREGSMTFTQQGLLWIGIGACLAPFIAGSSLVLGGCHLVCGGADESKWITGLITTVRREHSGSSHTVAARNWLSG